MHFETATFETQHLEVSNAQDRMEQNGLNWRTKCNMLKVFFKDTKQRQHQHRLLQLKKTVGCYFLQDWHKDYK